MPRKKAVVTEFDARELYQTEVEPVMKQLYAFCHLHKIPMYATFAVADDGKDTEYQQWAVTSFDAGKTLQTDRVKDMIKISNDFELVPKRTILEFDEDELF